MIGLRLLLALVLVTGLVAPGRAASVNGLSYDTPQVGVAWTRAGRGGDGDLYEYDFTGENRRPGAIIMQVNYFAGSGDDPAATMPAILDRGGILLGLAPIANQSGTNTSGDKMAWARRVGTAGTAASTVTAVAMRAGSGLAVAHFITVNASGAQFEVANAAFARTVGSMNMGFGLRPAIPQSLGASTTSMDGLYILSVTNFVMNPYGGQTMTSDWYLRLFQPDGTFAGNAPAAGENVAQVCARGNEGCGTYRIDGNKITLSVVRAPYGLVETSTLDYKVGEKSTVIGRYPHWKAKAPPTSLQGTFKHFSYAGGPNGSMSGISQFDFTADGSYRRQGTVAATTIDPVGGTGASSSGLSPDEKGRYAVDGFVLNLTSSDGRKTALSLVPVGSDSFFIGGDYYELRN